MFNKLETKFWEMLLRLKNDERGQSELLSAIGLLALAVAVLVIIFPQIKQALTDAVNRVITSVTTLF
ncbi:hypothetical protein Tfer_0918 [Thermincola ferriacetica]|uniref:Uncharacterized protein n=1 Tax=Thermincola ferriacetica TaxID=281456 RepID=A0A0L6W452_9FIRM|nr:hypothetical protein [Thermincola ferriacetica]KNZ70357.1 hypothetical protein Tfer_0918 [Thermincola ferriacetica]